MNSTSVSDLKLALSQKFEVLCFEDLADYVGKHGSIFKLFQSLYRVEFNPFQRLILYSSYEPTQELINHVQRAASKVDISNFFILIITPFDLSVQLNNAVKKYGADIPMSSLQLNLVGSKAFGEPKFFYNYETICVYPFTHVDVAGKQAKACCKIDRVQGNLSDTTIDKIFQSESYQTLRQNLVNGKKIPHCDTCWDTEKSGLTSLRQHGLHRYGSKFETSWFDDVDPKVITLAPGNLCNFHCRICTATASSTIAVTELGHTSDKERQSTLKKLIAFNKTDYVKSLPDQILSRINTIEELHINGGEPFMWPGLETLLDKIIECKRASQIQIDFNTNGSVYPDTIIKKLEKFKKVEILLSIDDIGNRFEVQRGGAWQDVYKNIVKFTKLKSEKFSIKITPTVNIQNLLYLDELVDFCNVHGLEIVWWYLEQPAQLGISSVTQKVKDIVDKKYKNHPNQEIQHIRSKVLHSVPTSGKKFIDYMAKFDFWYKQSFQLSHKEIFDAMLD